MAKRTQSLTSTGFGPLAVLRALAACLTIAAANPAFADNLSDAQRLIRQGQLPQAMEKVEAWLSANPKDAQGRFLRGIILAEMNKPTEAINVFTKLTEDYPELPEPYNNLAVLYAQQKQFDKARMSLETAIKTHPSYAIAHENLGDIYAKLASQAYDKALQIDNSNATTQNKLAMIRELISNTGSGRGTPAPAGATAKPANGAKAPTATVVSSTQGAAASLAAPAPLGPPPAAVDTPSAAVAAKSVPAPQPAPTPAPVAKPENPNPEITKAIQAWADAWSRKDMKGYFAAYAANFDPPGNLNRKAWEKEREQRIAGKAGKISVTIDQPQIAVNGDKATARFRQSYQAPGMSTSTTKTLTLVRVGKKWLIKEENSR